MTDNDINSLLLSFQHNQYQNILDNLYERSKFNKPIKKLCSLIFSDQNLCKAISTLSKNKIYKEELKKWDLYQLIKHLQQCGTNYQPKISDIKIKNKGYQFGLIDSIIHLSIAQILEPICEAKFYRDNYGYRFDRKYHHALAFVLREVNLAHQYYICSINFSAAFWEANHGKLLKQLWSLGIQDKRLLSIISKILKIQDKGIFYTGILYSLLFNIYLNEFDNWIGSQWVNFDQKRLFGDKHKFRKLRNSNLKEMYLVRYKDQCLILCPNYNTAKKVKIASEKWLKERLQLNCYIQIKDIREKPVYFLGFQIKAVNKRNKIVCFSKISPQTKSFLLKNLKKAINFIKKNPTANNVNYLNSQILFIQNKYCKATHAVQDFSYLYYQTNIIFNSKKMKSLCAKKPNPSYIVKNLYPGYHWRIKEIDGVQIFPLYACKNSPPLNYSQNRNKFTKEGRKLLQLKSLDKTKIIQKILAVHTRNTYKTEALEAMALQNFKCKITKENFGVYNMECHHVIPLSMGGSNKSNNLIWITPIVHKLIHATQKSTIHKLLKSINLSQKEIDAINFYRKLSGNNNI